MLRWWPCAPCVDVSSAKAIFLSVTNLDWLLVSVGTWSFLGGGRVAGRGSVDSAILAQVSARVERLNVRFKERPSSLRLCICAWPWDLRGSLNFGSLRFFDGGVPDHTGSLPQHLK